MRTSKKNICIVTPSFAGGGAERVAINLANYYSSKGYNVTLLVFQNRGPYAHQVSGEVNIVSLNTKRVRYGFLKLLKALQTINPDSILSVLRDANIMLGLVCFFLPKKHLVFREASTMHAVKQLPFLKRIIYLFLMRISYNRANCIIANSKGTKEDLMASHVTSDEKCKVVGNPVLPANYETLANENLSHPWLDNPCVKTILNVARLHKVKNHAMLIEAFAEARKHVENIRLLILGDGTERENLILKAKNLGVEDLVQIMEFQENPYPFYKRADLFVLTSNWEGFGNVIIEAMACGTPVISTDCPGGPREILKDGEYGILIPVGDTKALSMKIVEFFQNRATVDVNSAKLRALEYSVERIAEKYLDILTS